MRALPRAFRQALNPVGTDNDFAGSKEKLLLSRSLPQLLSHFTDLALSFSALADPFKL